LEVKDLQSITKSSSKIYHEKKGKNSNFLEIKKNPFSKPNIIRGSQPIPSKSRRGTSYENSDNLKSQGISISKGLTISNRGKKDKNFMSKRRYKSSIGRRDDGISGLDKRVKEYSTSGVNLGVGILEKGTYGDRYGS